MPRWVVGNKKGEGVWMTLDADDEEEARAEWRRVLDWPEDESLDLIVTPFNGGEGHAQWIASPDCRAIAADVQEIARLRGCLLAIAHAPIHTTLHVVRAVARDAVLNLIPADVARHQLDVRSRDHRLALLAGHGAIINTNTDVS